MCIYIYIYVYIYICIYIYIYYVISPTPTSGLPQAKENTERRIAQTAFPSELMAERGPDGTDGEGALMQHRSTQAPFIRLSSCMLILICLNNMRNIQ